jgi:hypothetical protein
VRRKLKSPVWDEFERVLVGGKMKAECQWCHNKLVGETRDGTSHLRAFGDMGCPVLLMN